MSTTSLKNSYQKKSKKHYTGMKQQYIDDEVQSISNFNTGITYDKYKNKVFENDNEPIQQRQIDTLKFYGDHPQHNFSNQKIMNKEPAKAIQNDRYETESYISQDDRILEEMKKLANFEKAIHKEEEPKDIEQDQEQPQDIQEDLPQEEIAIDGIEHCPETNEEFQRKKEKQNQYNQKFLHLAQIKSTPHHDIITDLFSQHKDYVAHMSGLCKCFTCDCNMMCKCGFKQLIILFKMNNKSQYQQHHINHFIEKKNNQLNQDIQGVNQRISNIKPLDKLISKDYYLTTTRNDFKNNNVFFGNRRFNHKSIDNKPHINYLTSNQVNILKKIDYMNKKCEKVLCNDNQKKQTVIRGVKFQGQTAYKTFFNKPTMSQNNFDFFTSRQSTIPLKSNQPMIGQTTNNQNFQKVSLNLEKINTTPKGNLMCLDTLSSFYSTTSRRAYQGQNVQTCR